MKMKKALMTLTLAFLTIALAACSTSGKPSDSNAGKETVKVPDKLIFGYLPNEENIDDDGKKGRELLMKNMSEAIGIPVEVVILSDYNAVIEAMKNNKVQIASFGPFSYIIANERSNAEAVCVTAKNEKDAVYQSYLITRSDSGINSLADVKGKSMTFVDPASTSGNLVPRNMLIKGLNIKPEEVDQQFASVQFAGSHLNSLQAVLNKSVEVGAVSSGTFDKGIKEGIFKEGEIKIIEKSDQIPSSPIAVYGNLPQDLKDKIIKFFHTFDNEEYFKLRGSEGKTFVPVKDDMYDSIREIAKLLNLSPDELLKQ